MKHPISARARARHYLFIDERQVARLKAERHLDRLALGHKDPLEGDQGLDRSSADAVRPTGLLRSSGVQEHDLVAVDFAGVSHGAHYGGGPLGADDFPVLLLLLPVELEGRVRDPKAERKERLALVVAVAFRLIDFVVIIIAEPFIGLICRC